jgi:hypothetical protein
VDSARTPIDWAECKHQIGREYYSVQYILVVPRQTTELIKQN